MYHDTEHPLSWPDNYYTDGARVFDLSMNGRRGELVRASYYPPDKGIHFNNGYFNKNRFTHQYVEVIQNSSILQFKESDVFTIDAWFSGGSSGSTGGTIFGFGTCDFYNRNVLDTQIAPPSRGEGSVLSIVYRGYYLIVDPVTTSATAELGYLSSPSGWFGPGAGARWVTTKNFQFASYRWNHIAAIYGGSNVNDSKIYINGEECEYRGKYDTGPADIDYGSVIYDQPGLGTEPCRPALGSLGWDRYFGGYISSFKIYNRALTHEEIRMHHRTFRGRYGTYRYPYENGTVTPFDESGDFSKNPADIVLPDDLPE